MTMTDERERKQPTSGLAAAVRLLRINEKITLRDFGEKAGVSYTDIFRIEAGITKNPSIFVVEKIAKAFGMTVDELLNFTVQECPTCHGSGWVALKEGE